ncbi:MAG: cupin domain-containing protein [Hyphococcus sp.]
MTHLSYGLGDSTGEHSHGFEQCGVVLSGAFKLRLEEKEIELAAGKTYLVPAQARHAFEVIEPGEVVIIAPPEQTIQ